MHTTCYLGHFMWHLSIKLCNTSPCSMWLLIKCYTLHVYHWVTLHMWTCIMHYLRHFIKFMWHFSIKVCDTSPYSMWLLFKCFTLDMYIMCYLGHFMWHLFIKLCNTSPWSMWLLIKCCTLHVYHLLLGTLYVTLVHKTMQHFSVVLCMYTTCYLGHFMWYLSIKLCNTSVLYFACIPHVTWDTLCDTCP